jgi:galactokinase
MRLPNPDDREAGVGDERVAAFAPGRVNLIGEHTDYNGGLCLPFALGRGITVSARPIAGTQISVLRRDSGEEDMFEPARPGPAIGWRAYVRGVCAELAAAGPAAPAARVEIDSDLPAGVGLSSSAALEVALALALLALGGRPTPPVVELARLCSRAENSWAGVQTGLLDQLASLAGRRGAAVLIDCRSFALETMPLALDGWTLATIDSGSRRQLAGSDYNERRAECRAAAERLGVTSLSDADPAGLAELPEALRRRARHVLGENDRVRRAVDALRTRDPERLAELINASHASLRDLFEVSTPAVEATVERARAAGARGARLLGGGFGGSVLALFPPGTELPAGAIEARPGEGAAVLGAS